MAKTAVKAAKTAKAAKPVTTAPAKAPAKKAARKAHTVYPLAAVRAMALNAQGLLAAAPPADAAPPTLEDVERVVDQLVCVQIDTLQMVHRSHYLLMWSRLGTYDPALLDRLTFGGGANGKQAAGGAKSKKGKPDAQVNDRRAFEYWLKAACIIPLRDYRYSLPIKRWRNEENRHWWQTWVSNQTNKQMLDHVRERIQGEGGLRTSDFEHEGKRGSWWDWKPAKIALEHLYNTGEFMIANRMNFQRVYDLTDRVLPAWVDRSEPTLEERNRYYLERAVRAHGICEPLHAADYTHTGRAGVKDALAQMIAAGVFVKVEADSSDGKTRTLIIHRDDQEVLAQAADGALQPARTTFLTPFDSLFWGARRDMQIFNFFQTLECYVPEPKRRWGYFSLPILYRDRLIGRFDPKLERSAGVLRIKVIHLEPNVQIDEEMVAAVAVAMRDFMRFHKAKTLVIEKSNPVLFGEMLMEKM
ncbi:MAG: YcaQ family DNA glycosylase [Anaerolineae bacterium]|nr:YcaQ family DNA glycosylase [Anaerolineae bacterium]